MEYPIMNKNKPAHFVQNISSYNSGLRKQDHTKTYQARNFGSGNTHNNSSKSTEEYAYLAQAAMEQGDLVLAQTYYQYAEHALRIRGVPKENSPTPRPHDRSRRN